MTTVTSTVTSDMQTLPTKRPLSHWALAQPRVGFEIELSVSLYSNSLSLSPSILSCSPGLWLSDCRPGLLKFDPLCCLPVIAFV